MKKLIITFLSVFSLATSVQAQESLYEWGNDKLFEASFYQGFCEAREQGYSVEVAVEYALDLAIERIENYGNPHQEPLVSDEAIKTSLLIENEVIKCLD